MSKTMYKCEFGNLLWFTIHSLTDDLPMIYNYCYDESDEKG